MNCSQRMFETERVRVREPRLYCTVHMKLPFLWLQAKLPVILCRCLLCSLYYSFPFLLGLHSHSLSSFLPMLGKLDVHVHLETPVPTLQLRWKLEDIFRSKLMTRGIVLARCAYTQSKTIKHFRFKCNRLGY